MKAMRVIICSPAVSSATHRIGYDIVGMTKLAAPSDPSLGQRDVTVLVFV
jgi:hypothetical protein